MGPRQMAPRRCAITLLKLRGYEVTPQLGVAGYRIDIAVKHPDAPGSYLAAIECDGASYHSAQSVRDRDRIRQEILESLGWRGRIWRIWSTDWFRTPRQETEKLISFLEDLRASWRPEHASGESWIEEGVSAVASSASITNEVESNESSVQVEIERQAISAALIDTGEDMEVEVGDLIRYADLVTPNDVLSVQITNGLDDLVNGVVNVRKPLAQMLWVMKLSSICPVHLLEHLLSKKS